MRKFIFIIYSLLALSAVEGLFVLILPPTPVHAQIYTREKLITVDIGKQMLFVFENGKLINQTKVSTGLPKTPTVKGSFSIYSKVPKQTMRGGSASYGRYYLPNVPAVMYFYQGYSIHGTYWPNKFGAPASHGCVNVPTTFAKWLYLWADLGTRVE